MTPVDTGSTVREAIGARVREIRSQSGVTQDQIARESRAFGLAWTRAKVSALESGRKAISAEELLALPALLHRLTGHPVLLSDLTWGLAPQIAPPCTGAADIGEAERKLARKLGVLPRELHEIALRRWGRSLTVERDARVARAIHADPGSRSIQAYRGRVTRALAYEIRYDVRWYREGPAIT